MWVKSCFDLSSFCFYIFFFLISFLFEHGWKGKYDMHLRARDDKGFGHSILPNWNAVAVLNPATYCATLPHPCRVTIAIKHSMNIRDQMFRRESNAATERVSQNNNSFHISTEWYAIVASSIVLSQADGYSSRERTAKVPSVWFLLYPSAGARICMHVLAATTQALWIHPQPIVCFQFPAFPPSLPLTPLTNSSKQPWAKILCNERKNTNNKH